MKLSVERLEQILEYANESQAEKIKATIECNGNMSRAALMLGYTDESTVRKAIARVNHIATKMNNPVEHTDHSHNTTPNILLIDI